MGTFNGATDRPGKAWEHHIKLLGEGDCDVAGIRRTLAWVNYRGPVGIQFYSIKWDIDANLRTTMREWLRLGGSTAAP